MLLTSFAFSIVLNFLLLFYCVAVFRETIQLLSLKADLHEEKTNLSNLLANCKKELEFQNRLNVELHNENSRLQDENEELVDYNSTLLANLFRDKHE